MNNAELRGAVRRFRRLWLVMLLAFCPLIEAASFETDLMVCSAYPDEASFQQCCQEFGIPTTECIPVSEFRRQSPSSSSSSSNLSKQEAAKAYIGPIIEEERARAKKEYESWKRRCEELKRTDPSSTACKPSRVSIDELHRQLSRENRDEKIEAARRDGKHYVRYEVSGTVGTVGLTYRNSQGGTEQKKARLPWAFEFSASSGAFLYVSAQNQGGDGTVHVVINVDGSEVRRSMSSGAYGIASADGRL